MKVGIVTQERTWMEKIERISHPHNHMEITVELPYYWEKGRSGDGPASGVK